MSKIINKMQLTQEETAYLESILRQATSEARVYVRAKILLLKHKGYTSEGIAYNIAYKLDLSLWLNMVKGFFSKMTKPMLTGI